MIKFEVLNRFTGNGQFVAEIECDESAPVSLKLRMSAQWALKNKADLREADLRKADLRGAKLRGANLLDANLNGVYLRKADLREANLRKADLRKADLRGADLLDADLRGANLNGADLRGASLNGADLLDANLRGANLRGARDMADRIVDGGLRSDGYRFFLIWIEPGEWRITAGCRNFTYDEAMAHWDGTRPAGTLLGDETRLIIDHMIAVARLRGWPSNRA